MLSALASLKGLIKSKQYHIDYPLFRLHYKATVGALLAFSLILTAKVLFGDTIDCSSSVQKRDGFFDNMCFSQGTFTEYNKHHRPDSTPDLLRSSGTRSIHQDAVETSQDQNTNTDTEDLENRYLFNGIPIAVTPDNKTIYWHRYYQYIPLILFVQAIFFYFPHYLWKCWENGIISSICKQLHDNRFEAEEFIESSNYIIHYLKNCFHNQKSLVFRYYFCHILLLLNLAI